jgi:hypothetical protein
MTRYQLVMRGGLTKSIEADSYRKESQGKLVFRTGKLVVALFKASDVIMVDDVWAAEPAFHHAYGEQ